MKFVRFLCAVILLAAILCVGCVNTQTSGETSPSDWKSNPECYDVAGLKVILISSNDPHYDMQERKVRAQLKQVLSDESITVVKLNTIYFQGDLLAAEVYYRENTS